MAIIFTGLPHSDDTGICTSFLGHRNQIWTFDGWLDEPAIYTNALSAAQISAHYNAATTNNAGYAAQILGDAPVGYWQFEP